MRFAFIDYAISYVISSCIPLAFEIFFNDDPEVSQKDGSRIPLILVAACGGSLLSLGNMTMQWSTTILGAPLTTVVAIQACLTVLIGTSVNFMLEPEKTERPEKLLMGTIQFLCAILLASRTHMVYGEEQKSSTEGIELRIQEGSYGSIGSADSIRSSESMEEGDSSVLLENLAHVKRPQSSPRLALVVAMLGGCCFGFFSPAFNIAVNNPFHWNGEGALGVPEANLWFSLAFGLASVVGNLPLMYRPPSASGLSRVMVCEYFNEPISQRKLAIIAGLLCGSANLLQFKGGSLVGFATADLVQAFPIVSTCWDVALFGEFRNAGNSVMFYISAMYAMYISGIFFMISSAAI